jgi:hypothetical protein
MNIKGDKHNSLNNVWNDKLPFRNERLVYEEQSSHNTKRTFIISFDYYYFLTIKGDKRHSLNNLFGMIICRLAWLI